MELQRSTGEALDVLRLPVGGEEMLVLYGTDAGVRVADQMLRADGWASPERASVELLWVPPEDDAQNALASRRRSVRVAQAVEDRYTSLLDRVDGAGGCTLGCLGIVVLFGVVPVVVVSFFGVPSYFLTEAFGIHWLKDGALGFLAYVVAWVAWVYLLAGAAYVVGNALKVGRFRPEAHRR